jgi:hypothetical protein
MASEVSEIDEHTSLEERHYWCTVLMEDGWDEHSAMEMTGLGVRVDVDTGSKECYIRIPNPNRPPIGIKYS